MIGLDMSFPDLYVDNNGDTPEFSKPYRHMEPALAKEQKRLSRQKEGSKRYERRWVKVAKLHAKAKHQRRDFLHKLSSYLVKTTT
ncbi:MAG: transposase [Lachnospiraceae bacterium]